MNQKMNDLSVVQSKKKIIFDAAETLKLKFSKDPTQEKDTIVE